MPWQKNIRLAKRLHATGNPRYRNGFNVTLHTDLLKLPLTWKKPKMIFVNSMSDLFHEDVPIEFILDIFKTMKSASWHTFQVLTKRADRLLELSPYIDWERNIWMGVTVENNDNKDRIEALSKVSAHVRFLSLEPLIGPINNLNLKDIDWVIVGGESGPKARPIEVEWVRNIRDLCIKESVPFFFKQWGGVNKSKTGKVLDGKEWIEYPIKL